MSSKAVDGDTNDLDASGSYNGFHTNCGSANEWWRVDLGKPVAIRGIRLYNRADGDCAQCHRLQGVDIRVGNSSSWDNNPVCAGNLPQEWLHYIACEAVGRFLFVVQPRSDADVYLLPSSST